ncbi:MAG: hypothetical protein AAB926_02005 [Patescibacteria group bacterium]
MIFGLLAIAAIFGFFLVALFLIRVAKREERGLQKAFGKEWQNYASRTSAFIPRIFRS